MWIYFYFKIYFFILTLCVHKKHQQRFSARAKSFNSVVVKVALDIFRWLGK